MDEGTVEGKAGQSKAGQGRAGQGRAVHEGTHGRTERQNRQRATPRQDTQSLRPVFLCLGWWEMLLVLRYNVVFRAKEIKKNTEGTLFDKNLINLSLMFNNVNITAFNITRC